MIKNLTVSERRSALLILAVVALVGLAMVSAASGDPMGVHGFIVLAVRGRAILHRRSRDLRPGAAHIAA